MPHLKNFFSLPGKFISLFIEPVCLNLKKMSDYKSSLILFVRFPRFAFCCNKAECLVKAQ